MAITTQKGTQVTGFDASPSVREDTADIHGRLRIAYFDHTQSGAGDATSSTEVVRLPAGTVRVLGAMCRVDHNWTTASATMDIGWDAYTDLDGAAVAADSDGIDNGIDVDTTGEVAMGSALTAGTKTFTSQGGVSIRLTSEDTAIADADTASGYVVYVLD
mgnify:CR=1 FL=1